MSEPPSDAKGKSKAGSSSAPTNGSASTSGSGGLSRSLASTLRTTMASNQLGQLLHGATGGKAEYTPSGDGLRDWLVEDLRSSSSSAGGSTIQQANSSSTFRSRPQDGNLDGEDQLYQDFERGMSLQSSSAAAKAASHDMNLEDVWAEQHTPSRQERTVDWTHTGLNPVEARPINTYSELDVPLHESVRAFSAASSDPNQAMHEAESSTSRSMPRIAQPAQPSNDIFALLDTEESNEQAEGPQLPTASDELSSEVLSRFDSRYRPPSPSNSGFSAEQAAMHLSLSEAQASEQGQQELLVPRPDNPSLREGVYAATAEDALRTIFEGRQESTQVSEEQDHVRAIVQKITKYFGKSSYLDDVYGLPPLLRETVEEATKDPVDQVTEDSRQKAIRRLESLWNHLSNTPPSPASQRTQWVDSWLRTNT